MNIDVPKNDDVIDRHQFYAASTLMINENARDINGVGQKVSHLQTNHDTVTKVVDKGLVTVKVIMGGAMVLWTIIGGIVSWSIQKSLDDYEGMKQSIEKHEKDLVLQKITMEALKETNVNHNKDMAALKTQVDTNKKNITRIDAWMEEKQNQESKQPKGR